MLGSILLDDASISRPPANCSPTTSASRSTAASSPAWASSTSAARSIDRVTVANELLRYNELESCDGLSYLVSLDDGLPQILNLDSYIRIVKDKSILRRIIFASQHMMNRCLIGEEEPDEILAGAEETLLKLGESRVKSGLVSPRAGDRGVPGRPQRVPGSQQAHQGHQHRVHQARRDDQRAARRRTVHPGRAAFHGQDGAGAEHRAARGHQG